MKTDYRRLEEQLLRQLEATRRAVAVSFRKTPPEGVEKFTGVEPSGCSFWRLAGAGRTFYTVADNHANCPIGAYTHSIPLPSSRAGELPQTLTLMTGLGYIAMDEVSALTDLGDDEMYLAIPGSALERLVAELATVTSANTTLRDYHRHRRQDLSTAGGGGDTRRSPH